MTDPAHAEGLCRIVVKRRSICWDESLHGLSAYLPCELCGGFSDSFEMHHRKFRSRGGLWHPSNILLLCQGCHSLATDELHPSVGVNVASHQTPEAIAVKLWHVEAAVHLDDRGGFHVIPNQESVDDRN